MNRRVLALASCLLVAAALASPLAEAHPGSLDANDCHTVSKTGEYQCHQAPNGKVPTPPVKKSTSGICYDQKSQYYSQTTNFAGYRTMKECTSGGGRAPK